MDVINVPNEESNFEVSENLLNRMLNDNGTAWLSLINKGRISRRLLQSLETIRHYDILETIRSLGIETYDLPDNELERIISLCHTSSLLYVLRCELHNTFVRIQRERLIKAIKKCPNEFINNQQGD